MIAPADFNNILFLDIETVACEKYYHHLDERVKQLWDKRAASLINLDELSCEEVYQRHAGIYSEFGKIIVIALGCLILKGDELKLRLKCIASDDEKEVLTTFAGIVNKYDPAKLMLCAHNGKEFDFPYIACRMLINMIPLPEALRIHGKKPWEIRHLDTMELWKFGDHKKFTSLDLLSAIFGIPSSKAAINGSQVCDIYYKEKDLDKIARYCAHDVINVAQVLLRMSGMPLISYENISMASNPKLV